MSPSARQQNVLSFPFVALTFALTFALTCTLSLLFSISVHAAEAETGTFEAETPLCTEVSLECLEDILRHFDTELQGESGRWQLTIAERPILVITDANSNRMRIMTPVAEAEGMGKEHLYRLMQANFESALDARYSIAEGVVWSVFIHPLSPLHTEQLVSAIAQTVTLALTFGTSFSSGALSYGGGDNAGGLFDQLRREGTIL
ncbi:MAG: hypothetical protein RQ757_11790 [Pseudomonadales bacterium]|nr:hypothetical protein [Pseudomonadales bacterium]